MPGRGHRLDAVEQHRLVGDRHELLGARVGDRAQARALAAGEDQSLQRLRSVHAPELAVVPGRARALDELRAPTRLARLRCDHRAISAAGSAAAVARDELDARAPATTSSVAVRSHASHSSITPRSSSYALARLDLQRARGSRSRLRTFCDFAYVQTHSSPSRTTYQSGIRCGQPSRPDASRRSPCAARRGSAATSSSLILICSRRLTAASCAHGAARAAGRSRGREHRLARVGGLEHGRVAGLLEHLAHEPVACPRSGSSTTTAPSSQLGRATRALLARPAGALGRDPDARDARGLDLAGARPAVDVGRRVDLGARLEASRRAPRRA